MYKWYFKNTYASSYNDIVFDVLCKPALFWVQVKVLLNLYMSGKFKEYESINQKKPNLSVCWDSKWQCIEWEMKKIKSTDHCMGSNLPKCNIVSSNLEKWGSIYLCTASLDQ